MMDELVTVVTDDPAHSCDCHVIIEVLAHIIHTPLRTVTRTNGACWEIGTSLVQGVKASISYPSCV